MGCSSSWIGLGTVENRLASVTCHHRHFSASLSLQNDFARLATLNIASPWPAIKSAECKFCILPSDVPRAYCVLTSLDMKWFTTLASVVA
eukprot:677836-Pleurochrysis_carterae.AAC.4